MTSLQIDLGDVSDGLTIGALVLLAVVAYVLARVVVALLRRGAEKTSWRWDDLLLSKKVQNRLALLAPALLAYWAARVFPDGGEWWIEALVRGTTAVLIAVGAAALGALLQAANRVYESKAVSRDRPVEAYVELATIVIYIVAAVLVVAVLIAKSPLLFVGGLGAMTAVLLLVFKDTILSFVASVQLVQSDMIDVGDWIEMPEFLADGDVIDVELHTVTVQNFDKTITTIPTYGLVTHPFRNWRGMSDSGLRRIKRSIHIDVSTIRFLTGKELEHLRQFEPIEDYMNRKLAQLADEAASSNLPDDIAGDPRRLTNIGTFRAYVVNYIKGLDSIEAENALLLVRQLEPGPSGLPLEIYAFARTTDWSTYEAIQADIFDHLLAQVGEFGLRVFQDPMVNQPAPGPADVGISEPRGP